MIEDQLLQYGAIGVLAISQGIMLKWFMKREDDLRHRLAGIIERNTEAHIKSSEVTQRVISLLETLHAK